MKSMRKRKKQNLLSAAILIGAFPGVVFALDQNASAVNPPKNDGSGSHVVAPKLKPKKEVVRKPAEPVKPGIFMWRTNTLDRIRVDGRTAKRLAKSHWLDKMVTANPELSEAITNHRRAAMILADHKRIGAIADGDPYLCRRITKWKGAARRLAANPNARNVLYRDPEGIYRAIRRDKKIIRILSKNPQIEEMIIDNPELGRVISHYM